MLEVNVIEENKNEVKAGQVRYNNSGMHVLIVNDEFGKYDAIVLKNGGSINDFNWNSKGQTSLVIKSVYPYIAKAKLEITK
jgi:hypothetical protein